MKLNRITYLKAGFCIAGFFFLIQSYGQYMVTGEVLDVEYQYEDVIVELKNGSRSQQLNIAPNGRFTTALNWNNTYYFKFRKQGYVSKVIMFSTALPDGKSPDSIEPYHMPVRLFKTFAGVDTVFFENPIAKIRFDERLGDFEHDMDYSLNVKYRIDKMRQEGISIKNKPAPKNSYTTVIKTQAKQLKADNQISITEKQDNSNKDEGAIIQEDINATPPLKDNYNEGETIEEYNLDNRAIKRHVFMNNGQRQVFLSVKHDWGGHYFFIDEAEIGYRCISKEMYVFFLKKCRNKTKTNK